MSTDHNTRIGPLGTQTWYSICSRHRPYKAGCEQCERGSWHTDWVLALTGKVYKRFPRAWRFFANLRIGRMDLSKRYRKRT